MNAPGVTQQLNDDLWKEIDDLLDQDRFSSLLEVNAALLWLIDQSWVQVPGLNSLDTFSKLLPKLHKNKILTCRE